jgi:plasmid stabilization system protein ParE
MDEEKSESEIVPVPDKVEEVSPLKRSDLDEIAERIERAISEAINTIREAPKTAEEVVTNPESTIEMPTPEREEKEVKKKRKGGYV